MYLQDKQEETDKLYRTLQQLLIAFYTTIKGNVGASGDQGEGRLSGKHKSTVFNMHAAVPDAPPNPLPTEISAANPAGARAADARALPVVTEQLLLRAGLPPAQQ